jgi:H/ACA ribonucleoprotein complex subunit 2
MGKDHSEKKEKKEKKAKRVEENGVVKPKKDKKDKKEKKTKAIDALEAELDQSELMETSMVATDGDGDVTMGDETSEPKLLGALVPFANPLAEEPKELKKILKTIKKCKFFYAHYLLLCCELRLGVEFG